MTFSELPVSDRVRKRAARSRLSQLAALCFPFAVVIGSAAGNGDRIWALAGSMLPLLAMIPLVLVPTLIWMSVPAWRAQRALRSSRDGVCMNLAVVDPSWRAVALTIDRGTIGVWTHRHGALEEIRRIDLVTNVTVAVRRATLVRFVYEMRIEGQPSAITVQLCTPGWLAAPRRTYRRVAAQLLGDDVVNPGLATGEQHNRPD